MTPLPFFFRRAVRLVLLAAVSSGFVGLSGRLAAQTFSVLDITREAGGSVRVRYSSTPEAYFLLERGDRVETLTAPVDAALGNNGTGTLRDAAPLAAAGFYRVARVPIDEPRDTDGDGIDDVYELRHAPALNALDATDALHLAPSGLTWLAQSQIDQAPLALVAETSPANHESGVAVTRETILRFSRPLATDAVLGTDQLYATFGGKRLLSRVELSSDHRKATLFYLEDLPASARVRVTLDTTGLKDDLGREVDGDADGSEGGAAIVDFDTLSITPVARTGVVGRVFASDLMADGKGGFTNRPLAGVTVTVDGAEQTLRTTTDTDGNFQLVPSPAGRFFVHVDGRTAVGSQWPNGAYYPFVGKAWDAVAGVETNLSAGTGEIFLPLVPAGALQAVSSVQETTITFAPETLAANPALAGVEVRVPANALFDDNGARGGRVGIAPVPPDRLPEPLPAGLSFPLVITIQTDGPRNFDRPVPVRFPNLPDPVTGIKKAPGEKSALWSFDHDKGEWDVVGPMTVTADGLFVETDPGVGVLQPGWHGEDPACKGDGTLSTNDKFKKVPDIIWNGMGAGFGTAALGFAVGASPIGSFFAGLNFMLDVGSFIKEPSWASFGKAALSAASIPPGAGLLIRGAALAADVYSTGKAGGDLINAAQGANGACNPGAAAPRSNRPKLSAQPGRVLAPPPTYFARNFYRGPQQTAALENLRAKVALLDAEVERQRPLFHGLADAMDQLLPPLAQAAAAPNNPFPQSELDALVPPAMVMTNSFYAIRNSPSLAVLTKDVVAAYAEFMRWFSYNSALVSIQKASGEGDPVSVLLSGYQTAYGLKKPAYYRVLGPGTVQRGHTRTGEDLNLILKPNTIYNIELFDPATLAVASRPFVSSATGTKFHLETIILGQVDRSGDADGDGLSDFAEDVIGSNSSKADSDGDGIPDIAEIQAGTNPLDNIPTENGVIGAAALPTGAGGGTAADVCAVGDRAFVALESAGLAIYDVSRPSQPVAIARVDTPGNARRVACDGNFAAVADEGAGLEIIDITDPPAAFISNYVPEVGSALSVTTLDGSAYVGTASGEVVRVHLASGTVLSRQSANGGPVNDLTFGGDRLYALAGHRLNVFKVLAGGDLQPEGDADSPTQNGNGLRVFVGGGIAYVVHNTGYNTFDVSHPGEAPVLLASGSTAQRGWQQIVDTGSGIGVAAVSPNLSFDGPHDVGIYDLRDPRTNNVFLAKFETDGVARSVAVHRGLAYVANHSSGFAVVNYLAADQGKTAPTISLGASFPLDPAEVEEGSLAAVTANAADDVQVREVEFYLDGELVATDGNFPFEHRFFAPLLSDTKNRFTLQARAIDTGGNSTWSEQVVVQLTPDHTPPTARPASPSADGFAANLSQVAAVFNEAIDPATLTPASFTLVGAGPDRRFGTADDVPVTGTVVAFQPETRLAVLTLPEPVAAGRFRATVRHGITDLKGNALAKDVMWEFEDVSGLDSDGDGLLDEFELAYGLDPHNGDQNKNGIPDALEDFDGDGLSNAVEMLLGTDPKNQRTFNGVLDSQLDRDGDHLPDVAELRYGTDWFNPDTDGDGWTDEAEVSAGSDPLVPNLALPGTYANLPAVVLVRAPFTTDGVVVSTLLRPADRATQLASPAVDVLRLGMPTPGDPDTSGGFGTYVAHPPVVLLRHATGVNGENTTYLAHPPVLIRREE